MTNAKADDIVDYFCLMAGRGIPQDLATRIWATDVVVRQLALQIESGEAPELGAEASAVLEELLLRAQELRLESLDS